MTDSSKAALLKKTPCEVRDDPLTRQLYATDASLYQIEPLAVAFPRTAEETSAIVRAASEAGIPVTARGAGSGLTGGAVGPGLIIDLARYNRGISGFDPERRTVRVAPGAVLDQLTAFLQPHGLCFGPDVATSSRATLGGMIGNNSSGARAPIYGTTSDHIESLDIVLSDGRAAVVRSGDSSALDGIQRSVDEIVSQHIDVINERMPKVLVKRWSGYGLDRYLRHGRDLCQIVSGSEGTLALCTSATLRVVSVPRNKGVCVLFFSSVADAMQATVNMLDLKPAAIEHIDAPLFDQTRGQMQFAATRAMLRLDEEPCNAILIVEFYEDDVESRINTLIQRRLGIRHMVFLERAEMELVWALRKAGLNLLTGRPGASKPVPGLEDVAIAPEQLPEYVGALQKLMADLGLEGSFYGHAASGLLHIRPIVDLHKGEDIAKYRTLMGEVSGVVRQFKGSIAAEHGVGIARTQYLAEQLGPELMGAMQAIKAVFDPHGLLNPGKMLDNGAYRVDSNLRMGDGYAIGVPFEPVLAFEAKDHSFVGNLEQCNGCGGCRKDQPTMCPTYQATGEEIMSTRGRANVIRAVLDGRLSGSDHPLRSPALDEALSNCLSCKACKTECPSNVDMALLKAELLHARHKREGVGLRDQMISMIDVMNWFGCIAPGLANAALSTPIVRTLMQRLAGITDKRPLPPYAHERFDTWFRRHVPAHAPTRGSVILWDDTYVRYNEPHIGKAAVSVLEASGYEVRLVAGRKDSGRPSFSVGRLDRAKRLGHHNVSLLRKKSIDTPIVFLEPSDFSMFAQDYKELGIDGADDVAARCVLFEQFVESLLKREPDALTLRELHATIAVHTHCHAKALADAGITRRVAALIPGSSVRELETGCCGMAGAFGMLRSKYDLSVAVAQPLVEQIEALPHGSRVVACGTSCRQQISHLTKAKPLHIAELLAECLTDSPDAK